MSIVKYLPPPKFDNPVLVDAVIQDIQTAFEVDLVAWLQYVYPKAKIGVGKNADESVATYPQVYKNDGSGKYLDIRPRSETRSFIFFEVNDPSEISLTGDVDENTYDLSLVCWFNLKSIDPSRTEDFTMELVNDVLKSLDGIVALSDKITVGSVEINPENAFDKYTLPQADTQYLLFPYGGFKINFDVLTFDDVNCVPDFSPGSATGCQASVTICELINDGLSTTQKNTCILPNFDFSDTNVTDNLTAQQQADLITLLC